MPDPGAWLEGLSAPVTVGWVVWLVWSLALVGWYRYALVAPKAEPRAAASRPPAVRHVEAESSSVDHVEPFDEHQAEAIAEPEWAPPPIDWSTAETAPAMHASRHRTDAAQASVDAAAQAKPPASYQFTTHRQDEVTVSRR